ncbi:MAG: peptide deformylase [Chitinophagales bacterium]
MAILPILLEGEPLLRKRAEPVPQVTRRVQRLVRDMFATMYAADGVGLAAPQVGIAERIIVVDVGSSGPLALINPEIEEARGAETDVESCLSAPGKTGYVTRAAEVAVAGWSPTGRPVRIKAGGWLARVLQHEIDHLDGVLFTDKATGVRVRTPQT